MLRLLCDNPWEGGGGHQPRDVAKWTPDQVWFRLCGADLLKTGKRTKSAEPLAVQAGSGGMVTGRAADGTPIKGRIAGKSLARQLMEESQVRKAEEKKVEAEKS